MIELLNYYKDGNFIDVHYHKSYRTTIRNLFLKTDSSICYTICINQRYIELVMENFKKKGSHWYKLKHIINYA